MEAKDGEPIDLGCRYVSHIIEALPYADYNDTWRVPIMHTGLYGAVSNFWDAVLEKNGADGQLPEYASPMLRGSRWH